MKTKINDAIKQALEEFGGKYFIEGIVNKSKVIQDLDGYDAPLLEAFITNETIKKNFTIDIAGNLVMQTNKLIELFEADEYWQDSYTKYSKKIGLTAGGKFIDESTDVVKSVELVNSLVSRLKNTLPTTANVYLAMIQGNICSMNHGMYNVMN